MVLAGGVVVAGGAEGVGGLGGETVCGAGGTGLGATPPLRSSSKRLRRQSRLLEIDIEVHDLAHLHAIIAALRDADAVSSVERI